MESKSARKMLEAMAKTANAKEYSSHMDLISKEVKVFGIPGFDVINHEDWARQCKHEFDEGILKQVSYDGLQVVGMAPGSVLFKTIETVEGTDGKINRHNLEILIRKEADGKWRVVQEKILTDDGMNSGNQESS